MKTIRLLIYSLTLLNLFGYMSCRSSGDSNKNMNDSITFTPYEKQEQLIVDTTIINNLINNVGFRQIPYYDSTNFDNVSDFEPLNDTLINLLDLKKVYPYDIQKVKGIWIRDKVFFSEKFCSLIIGFYPNENELFTTLVTYSNDFELIDFELIAYDEIAESCFRTESYIDRNQITAFNMDFCFNATTDTVVFEITTDGEIITSN